MPEENRPANAQSDLAINPGQSGNAPKENGFANPSRDQAETRSDRPSSHAGAVLRRRPPVPVLSQPAPKRQDASAWTVERSRPPSSIVDTKDTVRSRPPLPRPPMANVSAHSNIVDMKEKARTPSSYRPGFAHSDIVDIKDNGLPVGLPDFEDTGFTSLPSQSLPGIPTEDHTATETSVSRSGPDEDRVRSMVEARKRNLRERATSMGRDPGAGSVVSPISPHLTRSAKTHEGYQKTGERLMKRYRRTANLVAVPIESIDPIDFVNYCFSIKPTIKPSAWRSYKPGIRTMLDSLPHERTDEAIQLLQSDFSENVGETKKKDTKPRKGTGGRVLERRTGAKKEKRFPRPALQMIITYLKHINRSKFAPALIDWLVAGIATGLRPIEWAATDLEIREDLTAPLGRRVWLYVVNAKTTNGKGNGLVRTLDLTDCTEETIAAVRRMSERGYEWQSEGKYADTQRQVSQVLYKACDMIPTLEGKTYALYSLRHQFVANAKSRFKPEFVAAMCGHGVVDTSIANYGKKTSAWKPEDIKDQASPVDDEVALIQPRFIYFEQRVKIEQEAGILKMTPGGGSDDYD